MNSTNPNRNLSEVAPTNPVQAIGDLRSIASNNLNNRDDRQIDGLGFYSNSHRGVLTHPKSNMHIHFKTIDDKLFVGHINNSLILKPGSYLLLPKEIRKITKDKNSHYTFLV